MQKNQDIATNRKALRDYHILATYEAGIELRGTEVKSIRQGHLNLNDAFARIDKGQCWLFQCDILPYDKASHTQHEGRRERRLLLHKKEIVRLYGQAQVKDITIVALRAYWKDQKVKLQIGLGKGKDHHDKREDLKERESKREIAQELARRR
jgi:SsrA-binding protein